MLVQSAGLVGQRIWADSHITIPSGLQDKYANKVQSFVFLAEVDHVLAVVVASVAPSASRQHWLPVCCAAAVCTYIQFNVCVTLFTVYYLLSVQTQ